MFGIAKQNIYVNLRWMTGRDMTQIFEIEKQSFEPTWAWNKNDFRRYRSQKDCAAMTAEYQEIVVGYIIYRLQKRGLFILNFAVSPRFRFKGIGRQIIKELIGKLSARGRTRIALALWEENLDAQLFFQRLGFRAIAVRDNYFEGGETAYLFNFNVIYDKQVP